MTLTEIIVTLVVAIIGSSGVGTVISIIVNRHYQKKDEKQEDLTILMEAVAAVTHDSYFRHCRFLLPKNPITEDEMENHNYLYKAYNSLEMNGMGDKMHEMIMEKKVIPNGVEWEIK